MKQIIITIAICFILLLAMLFWFNSEINKLESALNSAENTVKLFRSFETIQDHCFTRAGTDEREYIVAIYYELTDRQAQSQLMFALGGERIND